MPAISVIVPIFNVDRYLKQCLDSILNQTYRDLEIILVNDGSTDNSSQIIDEYSKIDNRIISVHKENGGYGSACNVGLLKAAGDYISIVEPDDFIDLNMYEELYNIAKKYDSDIVKSCFYEEFENENKPKTKKITWSDFIPEDKTFIIKEYPYFLHNHPSIWSCIYKKEFLERNQIRFIEAPGAGWTDNPFQIQTMCLAEKINYTPNAYYHWRRFHLYESDNLKDYTIPFKRCDEIHKWLEENNINDEIILAGLYKRELSYINIVLEMKKIKDLDDCLKRIKSMCKRMDKKIIFNNSYTDFKTRRQYLKFMKHPLLCRLSALFKQYRRNIIKIRLNTQEPYIILFGKNLLRSI